jgi:hypothetical protein
LGDRQVNRLRHRDVEPGEQPERPQQLDHRGHLHRLSALCALHGRLADPGLGGQLDLRQVALEAVALEPAAELGEHGGVGHDFINMHRF